jgi:hypothetical protein
MSCHASSNPVERIHIASFPAVESTAVKVKRSAKEYLRHWNVANMNLPIFPILSHISPDIGIVPFF